MILKIYVIITLLCLFFNMLEIMVSKLGLGPQIDPFELMKEIQETLDEMEESKLKNIIVNTIEACLENPTMGIAILFLFSFLPLLHILLLLSSIKSLLENLINR